MLFGEKIRIGSGKKTGIHPERMEEETEYPEPIRKKYRKSSGNSHEGRCEIRNLSGKNTGSHPEIVMKGGVKSGTYPEKHPEVIRK